MKNYKWKDVIEFLEENPKLEFDYGSITECLMGKFFQKKLGERNPVSYSGWNCGNKARIVDPPHLNIGAVLMTNRGVIAKTSEDILKEIKKKGLYNE